MSPYSYNSSNELTALPSGNYGCDKNGNTQTKPDGTQYMWDLDNELTQVTLPGMGGTVNFKYDPFGRRSQKAFTHNGVTTPTDYLYDGANRIEDVGLTGDLLARYVQGGIDEPLEQLVSGATSYYESDGLGSVTSLSNSSGALARTYSYDSYGKLLASSGAVTNPFEFTGREFDSETGVYEYRSRYFDTLTGRFTSEDQLGFGGGVNFYAYGLDNPTDLEDPYGTQSTQLPPGCPYAAPCGQPLYGPSPTGTEPPAPPVPSVPPWWPGNGPGAGSSPIAGPGPSPKSSAQSGARASARQRLR